jgi:hypothetical protein
MKTMNTTLLLTFLAGWATGWLALYLLYRHYKKEGLA